MLYWQRHTVFSVLPLSNSLIRCQSVRAVAPLSLYLLNNRRGGLLYYRELLGKRFFVIAPCLEIVRTEGVINTEVVRYDKAGRLGLTFLDASFQGRASV